MTSFTKLRQLENPGGFSKEQAALKFKSGFEFNGGSLLKGEVSNIDFNSSSVFEAFCFEEACFENQGIWTTALTSSQSKQVSGTTYYWIDCNKDSRGFGWLVDIYNVCFDTGQMSLLESNVPIKLDFTFSSKQILNAGLKIVALKKLSPSSCEEIQYLYSDFNSQAFIKHKYSNLAPLLASYQSLDLEELSISLFLLSTSKKKQINLNQKSYYFAEEQDIYLDQLIEKNLDKLISLKDQISNSKRRGSIPSTLTTYLTSDFLYKDNFYIDPKIYVFEKGCFEEDCFGIEDSPLLSSREVDNRSIAWALITLIQRSISTQISKYDQEILELSSYLKNQIDEVTGVIYKGWDHSNVLSESKLNKEFLFSTSAVSLLALFYSYSYTKDYPLLLDILNLSKAIEKQFFNLESFRFKDSNLEESKESISSIIYGLLYALVTDRADLIERLLIDIEPYVNQAFGKYSEVLLTNSNNELISNGNGGYIYQIIEPFDSQYLKQYPFDQGLLNYQNQVELKDVPVLDFLLASLITTCENQNFYISSSLKQNIELYNLFLQTQNTLLSQSFLLSEMSLENCLSYLSIEDLHKTNFFLTYIYKKITSQFPVGFGWLSTLITKNLELSKIVEVISKLLTVWYISFYSKSPQINLSASVAGIKQTFQNTFESLGVPYSIEELWKKILVFNSSESRIKSCSFSESFLLGNKYKTNSLLIRIFQPLNDQLIKAITSSKSTVSKIFFEENLQFEESLILFNQSAGVIDFAEEDCNSFFYTNILILENEECFITEGGTAIQL